MVCTPEVETLSQAPERATLSLLAAAALCARNALLAEHRGDLESLQCTEHDDDPPAAITLVATRVIDHIDDLMEELLLYEATLRDRLEARLRKDLPF